MPGERRTEADIRREIAAERAELAAALGDLRAGVQSKRRAVAVVGGALATGLAAVTALRVVRRFKS